MPLPQIPKKAGKFIRDARDEAHRRELQRELEKLDQDFIAWRNGQINAFESSNRIHKFHQGPNRRLDTDYEGGTDNAAMQLCGAILRGVMSLDDLDPAVLEYMKPMVETFRGWQAEDEARAAKPATEPDRR